MSHELAVTKALFTTFTRASNKLTKNRQLVLKQIIEIVVFSNLSYYFPLPSQKIKFCRYTPLNLYHHVS